MEIVNIKVKYLGLLRNTVGREEEEIVLPQGISVDEVLKVLSEKHGGQFNDVMFRPNGRLRPTAKVMVDDQDIRDMGGVDIKLQGNQEISLTVGMYPASGG